MQRALSQCLINYSTERPSKEHQSREHTNIGLKRRDGLEKPKHMGAQWPREKTVQTPLTPTRRVLILQSLVGRELREIKYSPYWLRTPCLCWQCLCSCQRPQGDLKRNNVVYIQTARPFHSFKSSYPDQRRETTTTGGGKPHTQFLYHFTGRPQRFIYQTRV